MSLFPAYAQHQQDVDRDVSLNDVSVGDTQVCGDESGPASLAREVELLDSDGDEPAPATRAAPPAAGQDYYLDTRLDRGNLRVSTLYYPGRPQYRRRGRAARAAAGAERARYWQRGGGGGGGGGTGGAEGEGGEAGARVAAVRRALARSPSDTHLWLHLLFLQETWGSEGEALAVAEEGAAVAPSPRLRAERHRLRCLHLPHDELLQRLRADIDREAEGGRARVEAWERLVRAAAERGGPDAAGGALRAALGARSPAALYPRLLLEYGASLRAAGLWERLVLLLELVAAMNFPRAAFPSPAPALEAELQDREDELVASGLPLSTVWVRVERARAELHWRAAGGDPADPQRAPLPADVADLLLPVADPDALLLLAVNALRLAKVPLLGTSAAGRAALGGAAEGGACGERLVALQWAARRLPASHGARLAPDEARRALGLLLDPPHALSDRAGFLSWLEALWEAGCAALEGARRTALVCWRLRWLAALAALAEPAEGARLRSRARGVLRRWAGGAPGAGGALCFAQWARLERALGGSGLEPALHALRAATKDPAEPHHHLLYLARVVAEVSSDAPPALGRWALACAALRRPLPPAQLLDHAPPTQHMDDALQACEEQCALLERSLGLTEESEGGEWDEWDERDERVPESAAWALLPDAGGEWAAARALLTAAPARGPLAARTARLAARAHSARAHSARARRYAEHAAAALAALDRRAARLLAHLHPDNPLLALVSAGTPVWAAGAGASQWLQRALRPPGDPLAALLPPLRRALLSDWQPEDAARVCAACARLAGGGPLVWALRLEAEARAPRPRTKHALYAALDRHPYHKWLAVRGAQWEGGEAGSLADVLLERQCRLHALPEELLPPTHALAAPHTSPTASIVK